MKYLRIVLSYFILGGFGSIYAQVNTYFNNNPIWTVNSSCGIPAPCIRHDVSNYYINGDSIVNNLVYKKIFKKGEGYLYYIGGPIASCSGSYSYIDTLPSFLIRSLDKKMFVWMPHDTAESVFYDFDLKIGDTLGPSNHYYLNDIYVIGIDSIYTANGYLKIFELNGASSARYLLEGIGNSNGLIEPFYTVFDCGFSLGCYSLNDSAYYPTSGLSCNLTIGIDKLSEPERISAYINQGSGAASLKVNSFLKNATLSVYNSGGAIVKKYTGINGNNFDILVNELSAGIYFLNLKQENTLVANGKMIVTKN